MDVFTHLEIAKAINRKLKADFSVRLHTAGFFYGMIKPDFSFQFKKIRHYQGDSLDFIQQEIKRLWEMDDSLKFSREFAESLGVVAHFIVDYFCFPHTRHFQGNLLIHVIYEIRLALFCQINVHILNSQINVHILNSQIGQESEVFIKDYVDFVQYLENLQKEYSGTKASHHQDLSFAIKASMDICLAIIFAGKVKKVAGAA
ncbi:MAG: zinc dependent phospholipase C family protein [Peptococcaceae bacterium]|nr:zinc dependent phospholipase C family protein [Peptococcaceae bacterium]